MNEGRSSRETAGAEIAKTAADDVRYWLPLPTTVPDE
jgi:hypothetical protein